MILVDSSVLIAFLRTRETKIDQVLRSAPVAICGTIRAEILAGARGSADRVRLMTFLAGFSQLSTPEAMWDLVGDNLAALYARGVAVPLSDAMVATFAIENDFQLWARDAHFPAIQGVLTQLKLYQEVPWT